MDFRMGCSSLRSCHGVRARRQGEAREAMSVSRIKAAGAVSILLSFSLLLGCGTKEEGPIRIGAPLSTAYLYGWDAERGIRLAVEQINANGGIDVGGRKRLMAVEVIDTRDLEPGVPVDDAIKAVEKLILQKNVDFLVGGPVRSEAALAVMDLVSRYKRVSIITTGVLSPSYHAAIEENYRTDL